MAFQIGDAHLVVSPTLVSGFDTVLTRQVQDVVDRVSAGMGRLGSELTQKLTVPLSIGLAANLTQFSGLDAKLQETATLFSAVGDRAAAFTSEFRDGVSEIADEIGIFERDIAPALYQAISAGIPKNNVFEFLDVAARAAVGGVTDVETTVNGLTTAVNAFASQGLTAEKAADVLFRGVARGKTTFGELSQEMATAAPLAAAAGVQFEEFVAIIATMALSGTTTSEAITQIRAAINGVLRPSEEMNAIFQAAGFETAGLAVQQIGLQQALALVVTATRGETGELIKLLGGAEAANGALQITGDNAERFNSIFRDTSSATGAANAAFVTMSGTASQTFKNLFVQIDRVGSTLGEIAFTIVGPVVKGLTGVFTVVNKVTDALANGPDALKGMIGGFVGLLATIGPLLLIGSKLLSVFGISMAINLSRSGKLLGVLAGGFRVFASGVGLAVGRTLALVPGLNKASTALTAVGRKGLEPLTASLKTGAGGFGLITLAITGAVIAFELIGERIERLVNQAKFATIGAEKLADSLGLVVKPAEALDAIGPIDMRFRLENLDTIASLEEVADNVNLLEGRLIQIGWELIQLGNTPEEAVEAIRKIAEQANINVPIDIEIEDINFEELRLAMLREVELLREDVDRSIARNPFQVDAFTEVDFRHTTGQVQQLGEQVAGIFTNVGIDEGIGLLRDMEASFGANSRAVDVLNDAFLRTLMEANPALELTTFQFTSVDDVVRELYENVVLTKDQMAALPATAAGLIQPLAEVSAAFTAEQTTEQIGKMIDGMQELDDTVTEVQQRIIGRFGEIQDELIAGIPFWGQYQGAADLSVSAIITSLDKYDAAILAWSETSAELIGEIPDKLLAQLNQLPIDEKAALARLADRNPEEFDRLIGRYETTFNLLTEEANRVWKEELPTLIDEGNIEIAAKARELEEDFGIIGTNVATVWRTNFERVASTWASVVSFYANQAVSAFPGVGDLNLPFLEFDESGAPIVPQITYVPSGYTPVSTIGGPYGTMPNTSGSPDDRTGLGLTEQNYNYYYNYEYNITPGPGGSVPQEVAKIVGVARTQELLNRVYNN